MRNASIRYGIAGVVVTLASLLLSLPCSAGTYTAVADGEWTSQQTWGGTAPSLAFADTVIIPVAITVTSASDLTMDGNRAILMIDGSLALAPDVAITMVNGLLDGNGTVKGGRFVVQVGTGRALIMPVVFTIESDVVVLSGSMDARFRVLNLKGRVDGPGTILVNDATLVNLTTNVTDPGGICFEGESIGSLNVSINPTATFSLGCSLKARHMLRVEGGTLDIADTRLEVLGDYQGTGQLRGNSSSELHMLNEGSVRDTIRLDGALAVFRVATMNSRTLAVSGTVEIGTLQHDGGTLFLTNANVAILKDYTSSTGLIYTHGSTSLRFQTPTPITSAIRIDTTREYYPELASLQIAVPDGSAVRLVAPRLTIKNELWLTSGMLALDDMHLRLAGPSYAEAGTGALHTTARTNIELRSGTMNELRFAPSGDTLSILHMNELPESTACKILSDLYITNELVASAYARNVVHIGSHKLTNAGYRELPSLLNVIATDGGRLVRRCVNCNYTRMPIGTAKGQLSLGVGNLKDKGVSEVTVRIIDGVLKYGETGPDLAPYTSTISTTWVIDTDAGRDISAIIQLTWHASRETHGFDRNHFYVAHYTPEGWTKLSPAYGTARDYVSQDVAIPGLWILSEWTAERLGLITLFDSRTTETEHEDPRTTSRAPSLAPNPATDFINFSTSEHSLGSTYSIVDVHGRNVLTGEVVSANMQVHVGALPLGTYTLRVYDSRANSVSAGVGFQLVDR